MAYRVQPLSLSSICRGTISTLWGSCCTALLLLGLEAPVMTPCGVIFLFLSCLTLSAGNDCDSSKQGLQELTTCLLRVLVIMFHPVGLTQCTLSSTKAQHVPRSYQYTSGSLQLEVGLAVHAALAPNCLNNCNAMGSSLALLRIKSWFTPAGATQQV